MIPDLSRRIRSKLARIIYNEKSFESFFNVPIKFKKSKISAVNERILEQSFITSEIECTNKTLKILDFGCTRNWLGLSLASMGHHVFGIDLRNFPFDHPNFKFKKVNILDFDEEYFDIIISLSTIEHVGLGVYDRNIINDDISNVLIKIHTILKNRGVFIATLPIGKPSVDEFERSFSPDELENLILPRGFDLKKVRYYRRDKGKYWSPVTKQVITNVDNDMQSRAVYGSGVNGVGCYVFQKK